MTPDEIRRTYHQGDSSSNQLRDELLAEIAAQLAELNENFAMPKATTDTRTIAEVTTPKQYIIAKINETRGMFATDSDVYEDLSEAQSAVRTHTVVSPGYKVYEIREVQP